MDSTNPSQSATDPGMHSATFDTFEDFLRLAIKEYYDRGAGIRDPNFVSLLIASGQTLSLAKNAISSQTGLKRIAIGTLGLMAARVILMRVLTGPIGIILTGVSVASVIGLLIQNQKKILGRTAAFRELIEKTRERFEEAQTGYRQNRMDVRERNLIIEGLMTRFIRECSEIQ